MKRLATALLALALTAGATASARVGPTAPVKFYVNDVEVSQFQVAQPCVVMAARGLYNVTSVVLQVAYGNLHPTVPVWEGNSTEVCAWEIGG